MRSKFWSFMEACDDAKSIRAIKNLVGATLRGVGIHTFAIVTHAPQPDLRSLGVSIHNMPAAALEFLFAEDDYPQSNPLFAALETSSLPIFWPSPQTRRDGVKRQHRIWFNELRERVGAIEGVSQSLRSTIVSASCSVTSAERLDLDHVRLCMRIGNYAYQQILALQRPHLSKPEQLTAREHEFLYRATILGERPQEVASQLGVKISTVRTLRQKANSRLDVGSQEEAAWRMVETGQLFRTGRKGRPRAR